MTPAGIEPATFRFVAQHLNHCATAILEKKREYQEYFLGSKGGRCLGLTTLTPLCADCLEIWKVSNSWIPQGLSRPVMGLLYLFTVKQLKNLLDPTNHYIFTCS